MESQGYDSQAAPGNAYSTHPEVQATNPQTTTPAGPEKKGIAEKVKGLLGGHGHKTTDAHHQGQGGVYGDATPTTGNAESTRVGCLDKIKAKAGVGHGPAPEQARAHEISDPNASPDFNGGTNVNSSAAVHGGWPYPTNPHHMKSAYREHPNHATTATGYGVDDPNQATAAGDFGVGNPKQASTATGHGLRNPDQAPTPGGNGVQNPNQATADYGAQNPNQATADYGAQNPNQATADYGAQNPNHATAGGDYGVRNPNHATTATGHGLRNPDQAPTPGDYGVQNPNQATADYGAHDPNQVTTDYGEHEPNHATAGGDYGVGNPNHATAATGFDAQNPNEAAATSGYGDPQPTNPTGVTNAEGGAVLGDHHGDVLEGPRDDTVKKEGFLSKFMDKLYSSKGKPADQGTTPNPH